MRIAFYGAAGEVTGSCYLVTTTRARVMVDCGIFQGSAADLVRNARPTMFHPADLDATVVTHAHMDHTGRLPLLVRHGLRCRVHCTRPTIELTDLLLRDAAYLQQADVLRRNRERTGRGCPPGRFSEPLFSEADVQQLLGLMSPVALEKESSIAPGVRVRFVESGHIIGSTSVVLTVEDGGEQRTIVFSGDVGNPGTPIIRDPISPRVGHADVVILESTYGDRDHKPMPATVEELAGIINAAHGCGGKVLIPSFAVGRSQTLLYELARLWHAGRIPKEMPVFLDSPMAIEATQIYELDPRLYDEQAREVIGHGEKLLRFPTLRLLRSGDESRVVNKLKGPAVVIAGSGMATGGRIVHHLLHHLSDSKTHVVIVGYQAHGTLGRRLVEGAKSVRINGQNVQVNAAVHTLGGMSAHAGQSALLRWLSGVLEQQSAGRKAGGRAGQPRVVLTHGEPLPRAALAKRIEQTHRIQCEMPVFADEIEC